MENKDIVVSILEFLVKDIKDGNVTITSYLQKRAFDVIDDGSEVIRQVPTNKWEFSVSFERNNKDS